MGIIALLRNYDDAIMMIWKDEIQAILSSLIGGARYGVKIRLPHAVVMTCLFRNDMNASEKLKQIIQLVREHATNLALFAIIYKSVLLILKILSHRYEKQYLTTTGGDERSIRDNLKYLRYYGRVLMSLIGTLPPSINNV